MTKMQMVSAQDTMPMSMDWNHRPNSGPTSISISRASMSVTTVPRSRLVSATIRPDARLTTLCATSKTPMTMFQVFVTINTEQKVLKPS